MRAVFVVLPIFLLIGLGVTLKYKNYISIHTLKENNFILYWLAIPATLLRGILSADMDILADPWFIIAVWAPYLVTLLFVWFLGKRTEPPQRFAVLFLSAVRGNHFFAGIPIVGLAMGLEGEKAGTVILAFSLVFMQLLSIGGAQLALSEKFDKNSLKDTTLQLLKNPLFMTCFIGLFLVFCGLNQLPLWLSKTLGILSDMSTGLALIALGAGLQLENVLSKVFSVWKILAFKLLIHPVVTLCIFSLMGLSPLMIQAGTLLAAMPVAVNTAIIAQEMGMDQEYCGNSIAVSTLVSLISLPLWINVLGLA